MVIHQIPKKFRSVRMSGKLAKMSEKSDFEIFVPIPLCFLFSWPCSAELTLKKIMPLNLLSEKKKKKSIHFTKIRRSH